APLLCDGVVRPQVPAKFLPIPEEFHSLFKAIHIAGSQADPLHPKTAQLAGQGKVLHVGGLEGRLIDGDLHLDGVARNRVQVLIETTRVQQASGVFHRSGKNRLVAHAHLLSLKLQHSAHVASAQRVRVVFEFIPRKLRHLIDGDAGTYIDHVITGIEGEHGEPCRHTTVDTLRGLDVITVSAHRPIPAGGHCPERRIVHHRLGAAIQPVHFPDRLLRKHRDDARALVAEGADVPRGGQAESIAGPHGNTGTADEPGLQLRELRSQGGSVACAERTFQDVTAAPLGSDSFEVPQGCRIGSRHSQQTGAQGHLGPQGEVLYSHGSSSSGSGGWALAVTRRESPTAGAGGAGAVTYVRLVRTRRDDQPVIDSASAMNCSAPSCGESFSNRTCSLMRSSRSDTSPAPAGGAMGPSTRSGVISSMNSADCCSYSSRSSMVDSRTSRLARNPRSVPIISAASWLFKSQSTKVAAASGC